MAEEAKVALRNIRQDENNKIKKDESLREDERDNLTMKKPSITVNNTAETI